MSDLPRYRRHPAVQIQPDGDGAVALHLGTRNYVELNPSAWFAWQQLDAHPTAESLAGALAAHYQLAPEPAREAVDELLQALLAEGLVEREGGPARRRDRVWRRLLGR